MDIVLYVFDTNIDAIIARCRQLGLNHVCMWLDAMPGYRDRGIPDAAELSAISRSLEGEGIALSSANGATGRESGVLLDPALHRQIIDAQLETLDSLGAAGVGTLLYYQHFPYPLDLNDHDRYWDGLVRFMTELVRRAEAADVRIANHPVWRCLPGELRSIALGQHVTIEHYATFRHESWDGPYLVSSHQDLIRLLDDVPSSYNGACFCTGMHIMGADVTGMIDQLEGRIHHAQMRDVNECWPYAEEVFLGEGRVDFATVLSLLQGAGYTGVVGPEHLGESRWEGDDPERFAVEFIRNHLPVAG
jgi:sugar phosphate isomerase/epimerase